MSLLDQLPSALVYTGGSAWGVKWVLDFLREERKARRGEKSESSAIKTLSEEVMRLAERVEQLEKDIIERDDKLEKVNAALDEQRKLRRYAEDELDKEKRARRALEDRVAELERNR